MKSEIDPLYFDKPYYLEPQKGGERAYALMRDALAQSKKVGIAKVVLKSREHLAAVKTVGEYDDAADDAFRPRDCRRRDP